MKKYSLQLCKDMCLAKTQIEICGCSSYWLPSLTSNVICGYQNYECIERIYDDYRLGTLPCLKECNLPCDETKYEIEMSSKAYPTLKMKKSESYDTDDNDNIVKVNIAFKTFDILTIKDEEFYFIENLLGDIGGLLGLWSGFSFQRFKRNMI